MTTAASGTRVRGPRAAGGAGTGGPGFRRSETRPAATSSFAPVRAPIPWRRSRSASSSAVDGVSSAAVTTPLARDGAPHHRRIGHPAAARSPLTHTASCLPTCDAPAVRWTVRTNVFGRAGDRVTHNRRRAGGHAACVTDHRAVTRKPSARSARNPLSARLRWGGAGGRGSWRACRGVGRW